MSKLRLWSQRKCPLGSPQGDQERRGREIPSLALHPKVAHNSSSDELLSPGNQKQWDSGSLDRGGKGWDTGQPAGCRYVRAERLPSEGEEDRPGEERVARDSQSLTQHTATDPTQHFHVAETNTPAGWQAAQSSSAASMLQTHLWLCDMGKRLHVSATQFPHP